MPKIIQLRTGCTWPSFYTVFIDKDCKYKPYVMFFVKLFLALM